MNFAPPILKRVLRSRPFPVLPIVAVVLLAAGIGTPATTSRSQVGGTTVALSTDAFNALVGQLRKQQDQIAANQTKIEAQLAAAKEEVRQVKIYSARSGSAGRR